MTLHPILKKILKILFITWLVLSILNAGVILLFSGETKFRENLEVAILTNAVLGIPYYEYKDVITDAPDITKFDKKEWMNFKCKPSGLDSSDGYFKGAGYNTHKIPKNELLQLNCLGVSSVGSGSDSVPKNIKGELCSNYFSCKTTDIAVNDYVLEHPQILWNIIKVVERPCNYIKKDSPYWDFLRCDRKYYWASKHNSWMFFLFYPWYMQKRVFVVISIINSQEDKVARIVVRRQDI